MSASKELQELHKTDRSIRELNDEELNIYAGAVMKLVGIEFVPSFSPAIAIINPYYDGTSETMYTDRYSRVGIGPWFFTLDASQRASALLHEVMHVMNRHFDRGANINADPEVSNIAADLEINSLINTIPQADVSWGLLPSKNGLQEEQTFEQYYEELTKNFKKKFEELDFNGGDTGEEKNESQNKGESSPSPNQNNDSNDESKPEGSGGDTQQDNQQNNDSELPKGGSGEITLESDHDEDFKNGSHGSSNEDEHKSNACSQATDERGQKADEAGIKKASAQEQSIAREETKARIEEEVKRKEFGKSDKSSFFELALEQMKPPKVPWKSLVRTWLTRAKTKAIAGRTERTYKRVRRRNTTEFILPGRMAFAVKVAFAFDTSGSMSKKDYLALLSELEVIINEIMSKKATVEIFQVTTKVENVQVVRSVNDIELKGLGGTDMSVAFKYCNSKGKKERPDIVILATDGGTDWNKVEKELLLSTYSTMILITDNKSFGRVPQKIKNITTVLDISAI